MLYFILFIIFRILCYGKNILVAVIFIINSAFLTHVHYLLLKGILSEKIIKNNYYLISKLGCKNVKLCLESMFVSFQY